MARILDRTRLEKAPWQSTLRLARWIGSKRLPTCDCSECRAVVIRALGTYMETRAWTKPTRRRRTRVVSPTQAQRLTLSA